MAPVETVVRYVITIEVKEPVTTNRALQNQRVYGYLQLRDRVEELVKNDRLIQKFVVPQRVVLSLVEKQ